MLSIIIRKCSTNTFCKTSVGIFLSTGKPETISRPYTVAGLFSFARLINEILTFSADKTSAVIANTRLELLAYSLGLGGFYSLFILKADEIDHVRLMEFFPQIDKNKHMYSAFIIGYPRVRFRRTIPHKKINVNYL